MAKKVREQNLAVFGASGSGKTVLLSSFYGATREPSFRSESLYSLIAGDTGQGNRLHQNYLRMKNASQAPPSTKFKSTSYAFTVKPNGGDGTKSVKGQPFSALRLVWHDYPGEWFEEDPSSEQEAARRVATFTNLMKSDVALILIDGQKLLDHAGEEEKYLKYLLSSIGGGLERLKDDILTDDEPLAEFPRIWVLALSKADLHPDLDVQGFQNLVVEKAAGDVTALQETLKGFVQVPEALSLGEDFLLLSSAKFEPDRITVSERVGVDLILPVASMLPLERVAQWADNFDIPLKVLGELVDHAEALAAVLTGAGATMTAKLLARVPKVGPILGPIAIPALAELVKLGTSKLEEIHAQAREDQDYLTAILTKFRLDLEAGVKDDLLVKNPW